MKILAVDTSARSASAALVENGEIKGEFFINTMLTHSETLMPMVDAVMKSTRCELNEIDCFAVTTGPGSFTGLRIGIAAVKGMAYALGKPCASVSTLEAMAHNFRRLDAIACCVMDARCDQVYNALFDVSGELPKRLCEDRALTINELYGELSSRNRRVILVGDGAKLCYSKMRGVEIAPENVRYQRASSAALAAEMIVSGGKAIQPDRLTPRYLRLPQAQRELMAKSKEPLKKE